MVITAYNASATIRKSLESVAAQERLPDTLIIVDDASTDGTVAEAEAFMDAHPGINVRLVKLPHNLGAGLAKRVGIGCGSGDFVTFLDSDDFLPRRALKRFMELQEEYGADLVCGGVVKAKDGGWISEVSQTFHVFNSGKDAFRALIGKAGICNWYACSKMVSRRILDKCPPYSDLRLGEDTASIYHWFWNSQKVVVDSKTPLYLYNIRKGSLSSSEDSIERVSTVLESWSGVVMFCKFHGEEFPALVPTKLLLLAEKARMFGVTDGPIINKINYLKEVVGYGRKNREAV